MHWRRERLPTPVFWPGEFHRLYRGGKESDMTEWVSLSLFTVPHNCDWLNLRMWYHKRAEWILNKHFSRVKAGSRTQISHYSNVDYNANKADVKMPEGKLRALFIPYIEPGGIITFFPVTSEDLKYRLWSHMCPYLLSDLGSTRGGWQRFANGVKKSRDLLPARDFMLLNFSTTLEDGVPTNTICQPDSAMDI